MTKAQVTINILPKITESTQMYFTVIDSANKLNQATIISSTVLYGNINLTSSSVFIPYDNNPIAISVIATYLGIEYISILYTKAVYPNILPDNFSRLVQKMPQGVFFVGIIPANLDSQGNIINNEVGTIVGNDVKARSQMIDTYYNGNNSQGNKYALNYFDTVNSVYNNVYTQDLEFQYNGTAGLLSNSVYLNQVMQLLASASNVYLNSYDLELFISKYIWYRIGLSCTVAINDNIYDPALFWVLDNPTQSVLDTTTVLGPDSIDYIENIEWTIYNSAAFTSEFQAEVVNLIVRISRADVANPVTFSPIVDPTTDGFKLEGYTYPLDPRTLYGKATQYLGDDLYPLNVVGYSNSPLAP